MSYTPPFIPRADAAFLTFAENFCHTIAANPAQFMMVPAQAASLNRHLDEFKTAFRRATNESTRTKQTICDKDDARSILRHSIRAYAAFIRCNDGVTDGDKEALRVRPRNTSHRDRTCPGTPPLLNYVGSVPGIDQLVYHSSETPDSKAKPYGAERLELWRAFAKPGEPPPKVSAASFVGSFKKSKMLVDQDIRLDSRMEGDSKPTYWARWAGFDGSVGPWSLACNTSGSRRQTTVSKGATVTKQNSMAQIADKLIAEAVGQSLRKAA